MSPSYSDLSDFLADEDPSPASSSRRLLAARNAEAAMRDAIDALTVSDSIALRFMESIHAMVQIELAEAERDGTYLHHEVAA